MTPEETEQFLSRESAPRQDAFARPSLEDMAKAAEQAPLEAARCLGCACESLHDCKLRAYAVRYNVNAHRYRGDRRAMEFDRSHPEIDYQPGKCILCGLCIDAAQQAGEERGVAFVGRGFATRLAGAFDDSMADSLRRAAHECAEVCPAGAFTRKRIKTP